MTTPLEAIKAAIEALEPCPFCGGQPEIEEKRLNSVDMGGKPSALITVNIRHHCEKQPGVVNAFIEFRGRDHASAFAQWNTRTAHALLSQVEVAQVPSVEEVARVIDPRAFESLGVLRGFAGFEATRKKEQTNALEKATAILALFKGEKK